MKKITSLLVLILMTTQMVTAQVAGYDYAKVVCGDCDVTLTDDEFYSIARTVAFPINQYSLPENSDFCRELVEEIIPAMNAGNYRLENVIMRGAASPDGEYDWNSYLATYRQKAVFDFVNKYMISKSTSKLVSKKSIAEDYPYLLRLMEQANDKEYTRVKTIVEKNTDNTSLIKSQIMALDGGMVWKRLLNVYFPSLRAARLVLVFKKDEPKAVKIDATPAFITLSEVNVANLTNSEIKLNVQLPEVELKNQVKQQKAEKVSVENQAEPKAKNQKYPVLSVKTNLLYDFFYTPQTKFQPIPTIEAEYYFRNGMFSVLAEYEFPWWSNEEKREFFQIQNWQLEPRYYFKHDHYFNGLYAGIFGMFNRYDFALPGKDGSGVQGEGAGAGVSLGYVLSLGKKTSRWKLEFNIKAGYYETHYDPYDYEYSTETQTGKYYYRWYNGVSSFRKRNWRYRWAGPTGAGIKISYDLFRRKAK